MEPKFLRPKSESALLLPERKLSIVVKSFQIRKLALQDSPNREILIEPSLLLNEPPAKHLEIGKLFRWAHLVGLFRISPPNL